MRTMNSLPLTRGVKHERWNMASHARRKGQGKDGTTAPVVDGRGPRRRHHCLRVRRPRAQDPQARPRIQAGPRRHADPAPSLKRFELLRGSKPLSDSLKAVPGIEARNGFFYWLVMPAGFSVIPA